MIGGQGPAGATNLSHVVARIRSALDQAIDNYHPSFVWDNIVGNAAACTPGLLLGGFLGTVIGKNPIGTGVGAATGCSVTIGLFGSGMSEWLIEQKQSSIRLVKHLMDSLLGALASELSSMAQILSADLESGKQAANQAFFTLFETDNDGGIPLAGDAPGNGDFLHLGCFIPAALNQTC
jgi:hypothetical protein